jgi:hypothetical protein
MKMAAIAVAGANITHEQRRTCAIATKGVDDQANWKATLAVWNIASGQMLNGLSPGWKNG